MKQDCQKILPLVSELIDGALDADAAWKVRMHLSVCAKCAAAAKEFESTAGLMKSLPKRELSDQFDAALAARIAAIGPVTARRPWVLATIFSYRPTSARMRRAAAPAAVALAGLVAICYLGVRLPTHTVLKASTRPPAVSDSALLAACMRQHHSYVATDPLADSSAQTLASQVDASLGAAAATTPPYETESM